MERPLRFLPAQGPSQTTDNPLLLLLRQAGARRQAKPLLKQPVGNAVPFCVGVVPAALIKRLQVHGLPYRPGLDIFLLQGIDDLVAAHPAPRVQKQRKEKLTRTPSLLSFLLIRYHQDIFSTLAS